MRKILFLFIYIFFLQNIVVAQTTNISGVINTYTEVTAVSPSLCIGASITVASTAGFSIGDTVLLIQMQGADAVTSNDVNFGSVANINNAGNYERKVIASISGNTITFTNGLTESYDVAGHVQLVSIPWYNNAVVTDTLKGKPWDGVTGGIIIFSANTLTLNANIDASGIGFRGGAASDYGNADCIPDNNYYHSSATLAESKAGALKGEGISVIQDQYSRGKGAWINGGGGGNQFNAGGGGGGLSGQGGKGGLNFGVCGYSGMDLSVAQGLGGNGFTVIPSGKFYLGGGGGAGHEDHTDPGTGESYGGNGGGIIIIRANSINGNNDSIISNGKKGNNTTANGVGGGGSGGAIYLDINNFGATTLNLLTQGGAGGNLIGPDNDFCYGPGGGGGGGFINASQSLPATVNVFVNGGIGGITDHYCTNPGGRFLDQLAGTTDYAQPGTDGGSSNDFSLPSVAPPVNNNSTTFAQIDRTWTFVSNEYGIGTFYGTKIVRYGKNGFYYYITATNSIGCNNQVFGDPIVGTVKDCYITNPICEGDVVKLTTTGNPTDTYSWTGPNGYTSTDQNPIITGVTDALHTGNYFVTRYVNGCPSPVSSVRVIVNPIPSTTAGGNTPVCEGGTINLTATGDASALYKWSGPDSFISYSQDTSISNVQATSSGTYSVVKSENGCSSPPTTVDIIVTPKPALPTGTNPADACEGDSPAPVFEATGTSLNWYPASSGGSPSSSPPIINTSVTGNVDAWVTQTISGCESDRLKLTAIVKAKPVITLVESTNPISCDGTGTVSITLSSSLGNYDVDLNGDNTFDYFNLVPNGNKIEIQGLSDATLVNNVKVRSISSSCNSAGYPINTSIVIPERPTNTTSNAPICGDGITVRNLTTTTPGGVWHLDGPQLGTINEINDDSATFISNSVTSGTVDIVYSKNLCEARVSIDVIGAPEIKELFISDAPCNGTAEAIITLNSPNGNYDVDLDGDNIFEYKNIPLTGNDVVVKGIAIGTTIKNPRIKSINTGCSTGPFVFNYQVKSPPLPNNSTSTTAMCADGISVRPLIGSPAGGTWSLSPLSDGGVGTVDNVTANFTVGTSPGVARITYTKNGCDSIVEIQVLPLPAISVSTTDPSVCNGPGSATISIVSASGSYDIDLDGDGTYEIQNQATDGSSITISNLPTGAAVQNVKVRSNLTGCESAAFLIDTIIGSGPPLDNTTSAAAMCADGNSTRNLISSFSGGTWSLDPSSPTNIGVVNSTDALFTVGTVPGTAIISYNINGCVAQVSIPVNATPSISVTVLDAPDCNATGKATITLTSASGSYDVDLDGDNIYDYTNQNPTGNDIVISGLAIGTKVRNVKIRSVISLCESNIFLIDRTISAPGTPNPPLVKDTSYCKDAMASPLTATPLSGATLHWYDAANNPLSSAPIPPTTGPPSKYFVSQKVNDCESFKVPINVTVENVIVNAGSDKFVKPGDKVQLDGQSNGSYSYLWNPSLSLDDNTKIKPYASPVENTVYTLVATSTNGCKDSSVVLVKIIGKLRIPNAFSPNGDNLNDTWKIDAIEDYPKSVVKIYNRWGSLLEEIREYKPEKEWDGTISGTKVPLATYYYIIDLGDGSKPLQGTVTVVR